MFSFSHFFVFFFWVLNIAKHLCLQVCHLDGRVVSHSIAIGSIAETDALVGESLLKATLHTPHQLSGNCL